MSLVQRKFNALSDLPAGGCSGDDRIGRGGVPSRGPDVVSAQIVSASVSILAPVSGALLTFPPWEPQFCAYGQV